MIFIDGPNNYWFIVTFSVLSAVFSVLPLPYNWNDIAYSSAICALIGFFIIMFRHPTGLYRMYASTIQNLISMVIPGLGKAVINFYTFTIGATILHILPVYLLRNVRNLGNPLPFGALWFLIFWPVVEQMYPCTTLETLLIGVAVYIIFMTIIAVKCSE